MFPNGLAPLSKLEGIRKHQFSAHVHSQPPRSALIAARTAASLPGPPLRCLFITFYSCFHQAQYLLHSPVNPCRRGRWKGSVCREKERTELLLAETAGSIMGNVWEPAGGDQLEKFIALPHALKNLHRIGGGEGFSRTDRKGFPDLKPYRMCWEGAVARRGGAGAAAGSAAWGTVLLLPGLLSSLCSPLAPRPLLLTSQSHHT